MDENAAARQIAIGRIAVGSALCLMPGFAARLWIGDAARREEAKVLARGLGIRDIALGLGVIIAQDRGAPVRGWVEGSALADAGDALATLLAGESLTPLGRALGLVTGGGSTVAGMLIARNLE